MKSEQRTSQRSTRSRILRLAIIAGGMVVALTPVLGLAGSASEQPFLAENAKAMDRMMAGMAARPTGDIDQDFVSMMEPHHRGAVEMAQSELRHGQNPQLRRIAQEIIVEQQQEIIAMRLATGRPLPPSQPIADQQQPMAMPPAMHHHSEGQGQ